MGVGSSFLPWCDLTPATTTPRPAYMTCVQSSLMQDATAVAAPGHATPPTASPKKPSGALSDHDAAHGPDASAEAEEVRMRLKQKCDGVWMEVGMEWTITTGRAAGTSCWQHQIHFAADYKACCPVPAVTGGTAGAGCWQLRAGRGGVLQGQQARGCTAHCQHLQQVCVCVRTRRCVWDVSVG